MRFVDEFVCRDERYSLGVELDAGRPYLSIPVSNGVVDYEEYFALSRMQYEVLRSDTADAAAFAEECRRREHDDLLIQPPGWNRGTPV